MSSDKRAFLLALLFFSFSVELSAESSGKNGSIRCFLKFGRGLEWFLSSNVDPNYADVKFFVTTRDNPVRTEVGLGDEFLLEGTGFKIERRTVLIVHGFKSSGKKNWVDRMETAFRLWGDVNIIIVDWGKHANTVNYYKAAEHVMPVGREIFKFLSHIINATLSSSPGVVHWGPIHMVGHSLGSHICGIAADELKKQSLPWKVTRITGLDPAKPCFSKSNLSLSKNDADFVDVIHTHGKTSKKFSFGIREPIGHADFYPNGGKKQPSCSKAKKPWYANLFNPKKWIKQKTCSHGLSHMYFTESLIAAAYDAGKFWAHEWDRSALRAIEIIHETCDQSNCIEMGINAENYRRDNPVLGTFFVITAGSPPYYDVTADDLANLEAQIVAGSAVR